MAALAKILPEQMMLRWLNHHIRAYLASNPGQTLVPQDFAVADLAANPKPSPTPNPIPHPAPNPEQVSDLADDLADCAALAICLHQVGPAASRIDLAAFASAEPHARAATLIADALRIGVECFEARPSGLATLLYPYPRLYPYPYPYPYPCPYPYRGGPLRPDHAAAAPGARLRGRPHGHAPRPGGGRRLRPQGEHREIIGR